VRLEVGWVAELECWLVQMLAMALVVGLATALAAEKAEGLARE
jgi:hypothetical protein